MMHIRVVKTRIRKPGSRTRKKASGRADEGDSSAPAKDRLDRWRDSMRRALHGLWYTIQIAGIIALIPAAWKLFILLEKSPLFAVDQIEVEGCDLVDPEVIRALSEVHEGTSMVTLDSGVVSRRVEAHPAIQNATVIKRFPRCLVLKIRERRVLALVPIRGSFFYLDGQGVVFHRVRPGDRLDLPVITGLERYPWTLGRHEKGRLVQETLVLLHDLEAGSLIGELSEVRVDSSAGLSFYLEALPVPVKTGWERYQSNRACFERLIPVLIAQKDELRSIDLRFSDQVVLQRGSRKQLKQACASTPDRVEASHRKRDG